MDILLVDDETAFAGLLADRLRLRGYTVRCAPNAETALRLIGEKAPDVAFLDVGLPGMDGIGLLEKIRLMPAPVICCMLTGAAQVSVAARALRSGAFDWLATCDPRGCGKGPVPRQGTSEKGQAAGNPRRGSAHAHPGASHAGHSPRGQ